ncbi:MAG: hypothetical protein ABI591_23955 [Kofleriaceae bacterium]
MTVHTLELSTTAERAFAAFAAIGAWWDPADTTLQSITIPPRVGGRVIAHHRDRDDDWGEVTRWDPPRALAYGTIEIVFVSTGDRTIVRLEHAGRELDWPKRLARFAAMI